MQAVYNDSINGVEQKQARCQCRLAAGASQVVTGLLLPVFLYCVAEWRVAPQVVGHG